MWRFGCLHTGTSPRTRGKQVVNLPTRANVGNIPAHAGKTLDPHLDIDRTKEHPRARGENYSQRITTTPRQGTSPRTRGKHPPLIIYQRNRRNIPAHAGKTSSRVVTRVVREEHPRARGENLTQFKRLSAMVGTSPRTRGKLCYPAGKPDDTGNIPAHAGKTRKIAILAADIEEHPRARGENQNASPDIPATAGTSPRTRGKPELTDITQTGMRNIPAHAGKTFHYRVVPAENQEHPRARGENVTVACDYIAHTRNIPAHAGKTIMPNVIHIALEEHPRARGENKSTNLAPSSQNGTSPRTRGKRQPGALAWSHPGNIPAHAGKTESSSPPPWQH